MPPVIDRTKCIGCGMCADVCPLQVFRHDPKKDKIPEVRRPYECWHCNACVLDCRAKAIELRLPLTHMLLYVDSDSLKPKERCREPRRHQTQRITPQHQHPFITRRQSS